MAKLHGTATLLKVHFLVENGRLIDYKIDPPARNPNSGNLETVARVAVYPGMGVKDPERIVLVCPSDPYGPSFPWFQFQFPADVSDAEALSRIGYELKVEDIPESGDSGVGQYGQAGVSDPMPKFSDN